jgi:hypothetical protein
MTPLVAALAMSLGAAPISVAAPGFTCVGFEQSLCDVYFDRFVTVLMRAGTVRVFAQKDILALLGIERQKALLGCSDEGSCTAELTGALGAEGLLSGSLAKTESGYTLNLKVIRATTGHPWVSTSQRAKDAAELEDLLEAKAQAFADTLAPRTSRVTRWLPALGGGVVLVAGVAAFTITKLDAQALGDPSVPLTTERVNELVARDRWLQPTSLAVTGVAFAGLVASVIWAVRSAAEPPAVTLLPLPGGAAVAFGGVLP